MSGVPGGASFPSVEPVETPWAPTLSPNPVGNSGQSSRPGTECRATPGSITAPPAESPEFPTRSAEDLFENFTIDSNAGPLSAHWVRATGGKRGTVVFVHGFTGSKDDFRLLLPRAATLGWDAVAYSQRGHAGSAAPTGTENYTLDQLAADAANLALAIFEHCGGQLVHLVGHSLGGLVARQAVLFRPDLFASLTMLCSGPGGDDPTYHAEEADYVRQHGLVALFDRELRSRDPKPDDDFVRERFAASSADAYLAGVDILQNAPDTTAEVVATGVPTLVAHGDADDAWPIADQRDMAERLGAAYVVIPRAGHLPNIDNPDFTIECLSDFWTSTS